MQSPPVPLHPYLFDAQQDQIDQCEQDMLDLLKPADSCFDPLQWTAASTHSLDHLETASSHMSVSESSQSSPRSPIVHPATHAQYPRHHSSVATAHMLDSAGHRKGAPSRYRLIVGDIPTKSRVETQVKVSVYIYPPPPENKIFLPSITISKPKFQLSKEFEVEQAADTLNLQVNVMCASTKRPVNICERCLKRERKRALRKKVKSSAEEAHWATDLEKPGIVFNCKQLIFLSPVVKTEVNGQTIEAKHFELPMRMTCYCRHHKEKLGFVACFSLYDRSANLVAVGNTTPVMITDDHKTGIASINMPHANGGPKSESDASLSNGKNSPDSNSVKQEDLSDDGAPAQALLVKQEELSDDSASHNNLELESVRLLDEFDFNTSSSNESSSVPAAMSPPRHVQRRSFASPYSSEVQSPQNYLLSSTTEGSHINSRALDEQVSSPPTRNTSVSSMNFTVPEIRRIVPDSGSTQGGIFVTLLGSGFMPGLSAKFGGNVSAATEFINPSTIVARVPPAETPGPVRVTFENILMSEPPLFIYKSDAEKNLLEVALSITGYKMYGSTDSAYNIAKRIVGDATCSGTLPDITQENGMASGGSKDATDLENLMIKLMEVVDKGSSDVDWDTVNSEGQTMLIIAASLGFRKLCTELLFRGADVESQDVNGYTALHFASMRGHAQTVIALLRFGADPYSATDTDLLARDLAHDDRIVELLTDYPSFSQRSRSSSSTSLRALNGFESASIVASRQLSRQASRQASRRNSIVMQTAAMQRAPRGLSQYWAEFAENARIQAASIRDLVDERIRNFIPPNTTLAETLSGTASSTQPSGDLQNRSGADVPAQAITAEMPPAYDEIFPNGTENQDYSAAVIEETPAPVATATTDVKQTEQAAESSSSATAAVEADSAAVPEDKPEEKLMEKLLKNRKQLSSDKMLFAFWLPILIFTVVWISVKLTSMMNECDVDTIREKLMFVGRSIFSIGAPVDRRLGTGASTGQGTPRNLIVESN